jgi:hypothetical protein
MSSGVETSLVIRERRESAVSFCFPLPHHGHISADKLLSLGICFSAFQLSAFQRFLSSSTSQQFNFSTSRSAVTVVYPLLSVLGAVTL